MKLVKASISEYRNLKDIHLDFKDKNSSFSSIASPNGGGKSTLQQFIFTTIHCLCDLDRHPYLVNLLSSIDIRGRLELAEYSFVDKEDNAINLDIIVYPTIGPASLGLFVEIDHIRRRINSLSRLLSDIAQVKRAINNVGIDGFVTAAGSASNRRLYRKARDYIEKNSHTSVRLSGNEIISEFINSERYIADEQRELSNDLDELILEAREIETKLLNSNETILCKSDKLVVTVKTNVSNEKLKEVCDSIYLCAPNTQSFLFLSEQARKSVFDSQGEHSYHELIKQAKSDLPNFYTYDISPVNLILESFKVARDLDFSQKLKTSVYGNNFDIITKELNSFLDDKQITVSNDLEKVIFSSLEKGKELSPEDLSHGELKKLSLYVFSKHITSNNSIVLFDEIDIALHPSWQASITTEITNWTPDRQFIVATHSPQIIASTYYKNIVQLCKQGDFSTSKTLTSPPLDRDINAIVGTVMDAPVYPQFIKDIQDKYKKAINLHGIDSSEALEIKTELLEHISLDSEFFSDIEFDQEFFS